MKNPRDPNILWEQKSTAMIRGHRQHTLRDLLCLVEAEDRTGDTIQFL